MSLFTQLLILLIALTGVGFGILLAYIAPEEMAPGKKYLQWLRTGLGWALVLIAGYGWMKQENYFTVIAFLTIMLVVSTTLWKTGSLWLEAALMLTFAAAYLLLPELQLLFASLIFLYGLPTGTLIAERVGIVKYEEHLDKKSNLHHHET